MQRAKYLYREERGASWNILALVYSTNRAQVPKFLSDVSSNHSL